MGAEELSALRTFTNVVERALDTGADNVTVSCTDCGVRVTYRRGDEDCASMTLPASYARQLIARFKILADLDVGCRDRPQEGIIPIHYEGRDYRLAIATAPDGRYERIRMHICPS